MNDVLASEVVCMPRCERLAFMTNGDRINAKSVASQHSDYDRSKITKALCNTILAQTCAMSQGYVCHHPARG